MSRSLGEGCCSAGQSWATDAPVTLILVIVALSAMIVAASPSQVTAAGPARVETRVGASPIARTEASTGAKVGAAPEASAEAEQPSGAIAQVPPLAEQIQVEASSDLSKVVVGQQIVLRVLVIGDGPLPPGRLIPPSMDDTELLLLSENHRIDQSTKDASNLSSSSGIPSSARWVYEYRYALFPRSAGQLKIPPSVFSAWRPDTERPERLRSAALNIEVMPAQPPLSDAAAPQTAWLPAQQLSLNEAGASVVQLAPGQVIERMLTLKAVGLRAKDLPPIPALIPFPLQVREDAPRLWNERGPEGVTGYRTERITLSSAEPGLYRLPAITIDWWNVEAARWQRATAPEWQLQIAELDSSSRRSVPDWRRVWDSDAPATENAPLPTAPAPKQPWVVQHWPWIIILLGLLLLTGQRKRLHQLLHWRRSTGPDASSVPPSRTGNADLLHHR